MKPAGKVTLLDLLQLYENAIKVLQQTRGPAVTGLIRRLERHSAKVIAAIAAHPPAA